LSGRLGKYEKAATRAVEDTLDWCVDCHFTPSDIARHAGVSRSAVLKYIAGESQPTASVIIGLGRARDVLEKEERAYQKRLAKMESFT